MVQKASFRSEWVDYAKGLAIFIILFHHAVYSVEGHGVLGADSSFWSIRLWNDFEPLIRVGIFFFIVGLFIERSFAKVGMRSFVTTRVRTLLYPYLLWQTISVLRSAYSHGWDFSNCLSIFLDMPFHGFQQFWFLACLLQTLVFYVFCQAFALSRYRIAALCFCIYFLPIGPNHPNFLTWQHNLPYFAMGMLLADRKADLGHYRGLWMPAAGVLILAAMVLSAEISWSSQPLSRFLINSGYMAGLIMIAAFLARFERLQVIRLLGSYSLEVYCLQTFAQATTVRTLQGFGVTSFWVLITATVCASVVMPLTVGICDRRFAWRLFRWQKKPASVPVAAVSKPREMAIPE